MACEICGLVYRLAYNGDVVAFKMDRLEKQPTDLRRRHHYMRDGTLARDDNVIEPVCLRKPLDGET